MPPAKRQSQLFGSEAETLASNTAAQSEQPITSGPSKRDAEPVSSAMDDVVPAALTGEHDALVDEAFAESASASACQNLPAGAVPNIPSDLTGKTVWVVDAYSLIFQVFHAIPEMTGPRGEPVSAVFGFTRDVLELLAKKPDYLFIAFDKGSQTFRHDLSSDYKLNRTDMPADLKVQIPLIRRVLEALDMPVLECVNYEADDILAMLAKQTDERGGTCYLVTGDKDARQLITDRVKLYNLRKHQVFDAEQLMLDWGVRPDQVVDYQALVGDSVDNVPGVPLIGPKIARELLQTYDNLDNLLANADKVAGAKRKQNLIDYRDRVLVSRELVRLNPDVPIAIDWEAGRAVSPDRERVLPIFVEFGFHGLANKLRGEAPRPAATWTIESRLIDTPAALEVLTSELSAAISMQPLLALQVLTTAGPPRQNTIIGISLAWQEGKGVYLPLAAPSASQPLAGLLDADAQMGISRKAAFAALKPFFENAAVAKIGHDLKHAVIALRGEGVELRGLAFDSMLASYLLDAGERNHTLEELSQRELDFTPQKLETLLAVGKKTRPISEVPAADLLTYAVESAVLPLRLRPRLASKLTAAKLDTLHDTLEAPLIEVLAEIEFNGIRVDVPLLQRLSEQYRIRLETLESEIYAAAGKQFNIGSPKQLAEVLFVDLGLPIIKKTKTGASTDVEVLEELKTRHEAPAKIIEYRQFSKLKGTYVDALPLLVAPKTGRVHATFNQVVAATGRLSSSDPNLQNIPIRSESGREIRSAFLPGEEGWMLLAADYSQIELRVLAHFCSDENLRQAFANDEDIHARVASQVYGVSLGEVTSAMRRVAKAVNFGVIYGQSPFGLSKTLGITQEEAATFINAYFAGYPGIDQFLSQILEDCRKNGYVSTILGRRRSIRGVRDERQQIAAEGGRRDFASKQRNLSERTAINTVIQGSAADMIKLAMISIYRRLKEQGLRTRMLLQIHDELVFESPADELTEAAKLVADEMSGVMKLAVPLKVDLKSGRNWAEVEPWTEG